MMAAAAEPVVKYFRRGMDSTMMIDINENLSHKDVLNQASPKKEFPEFKERTERNAHEKRNNTFSDDRMDGTHGCTGFNGR